MPHDQDGQGEWPCLLLWPSLYRHRREFFLSYLPAADSEKESKDIGLLLFLKFLDVFEGTHLKRNSVSLSSQGSKSRTITLTVGPHGGLLST
jgi:hypothetical protein